MQQKLKVLFVCVGNCCRSPMAEGFARGYGSDVMEAASAGVAPTGYIAPLSIKVMRDRNIDISSQTSKSVYEAGGPFDIIVNMSGYPLPDDMKGNVREWTVRDPMGGPESLYVAVAGHIEQLVMQLIMELRSRPTTQRDTPHRPRSRLARGPA